MDLQLGVSAPSVTPASPDFSQMWDANLWLYHQLFFQANLTDIFSPLCSTCISMPVTPPPPLLPFPNLLLVTPVSAPAFSTHNGARFPSYRLMVEGKHCVGGTQVGCSEHYFSPFHLTCMSLGHQQHHSDVSSWFGRIPNPSWIEAGDRTPSPCRRSFYQFIEASGRPESCYKGRLNRLMDKLLATAVCVRTFHGR